MTALVRLANTPRVYATETRLHDPRTGAEAITILPRTVAAPAKQEAATHEVAPAGAVGIAAV